MTHTLSSVKLIAYFLLLCCIMICIALETDARTQRMAIPSGSYTVRESGPVTVRAFCVDAGRSSPTGIMSTFLGSGSSTTTVTRLSDNVVLSLSEAISEGWLTLKGTNSATNINVFAVDDLGYRIDVKNSFIATEHSDDLIDDIASTLTWLDTQDTSTFSGADPVWDFRRQEAESELGANFQFANLFGGPEELLELFYRLNHEEVGTVALTHRYNPDSDAFDRILFAPGFSVREFQGINADRNLVEQLRSEGELTHIYLVQPQNFEQSTLEPFGKYMKFEIEEAESQFWNAPWGSLEEREAKEMMDAYHEVRNAAQISAVEIGLQLSLNSTEIPLAVSVLDKGYSVNGGIINRNGTLISFDGPEPPSSEILNRNVVPLVARTFLQEEPRNASYAGQVRQGNHLWTAGTRALDITKESAAKANTSFRLVFSSLIGAVRRNQPKQGVIDDVQQMLNLERQAYEAYPSFGEAEVRLFFDETEELKMRVALVSTPDGIRLVALGR